MNIEIIDYQYGYAEIPINGTKLLIDDEKILDIDDNTKDVDKRVKILEAVLKYLKIDANVDVSMDFD
jgi:hypothetical protein